MALVQLGGSLYILDVVRVCYKLFVCGGSLTSGQLVKGSFQTGMLQKVLSALNDFALILYTVVYYQLYISCNFNRVFLSP